MKKIQKDLPELVAKLMALEAKRLAKQTKSKNIKSINIRYIDHKQEIIDSFEEIKAPFDSDYLKKLALNYLEDQLRLDPRNNCYKILKFQVVGNRYNFDFKERTHQHL